MNISIRNAVTSITPRIPLKSEVINWKEYRKMFVTEWNAW